MQLVLWKFLASLPLQDLRRTLPTVSSDGLQPQFLVRGNVKMKHGLENGPRDIVKSGYTRRSLP